MASADNDDLCESFKEFCKLAGSKNGEQMTSKACGKLVNDCLGKYNKYNVKGITDASAFSACKEKGKPHMVVTKESCDKLVGKIAHEVAKTKTKNNKLAADDEEVITIKKDMCACIKSHKKPDVKATKTSTTGGVKHLTDTSQYTGSHKERFDAEGKGKGTEGRKEIVDDSGYVGNYKDKGTYDNKKR